MQSSLPKAKATKTKPNPVLRDIINSKANLIDSLKDLMKLYMKDQFQLIQFMVTHIIFLTFGCSFKEMNFTQLCLYEYFSLKGNQWEEILNGFREKLLKQQHQAQQKKDTEYQKYVKYLQHWIDKNQREMKSRNQSQSMADLLITQFGKFYNINSSGRVPVANRKYKSQKTNMMSLLETVKRMETTSEWQAQFTQVAAFWREQTAGLDEHQSKLHLSPQQKYIYARMLKKKAGKTTKREFNKVNHFDDLFIYAGAKMKPSFSSLKHVNFTSEEYIYRVVKVLKEVFDQKQKLSIFNFKASTESFLAQVEQFGCGLFKKRNGGMESEEMEREMQMGMETRRIDRRIDRRRGRRQANLQLIQSRFNFHSHQATGVEHEIPYHQNWGDFESNMYEIFEESIQQVSSKSDKSGIEANQVGLYVYPFDMIDHFLGNPKHEEEEGDFY